MEKNKTSVFEVLCNGIIVKINADYFETDNGENDNELAFYRGDQGDSLETSEWMRIACFTTWDYVRLLDD